MVQRKGMGFRGLAVAVSVVAMFWVTDALDIGGHSAGSQDESLGVAPVVDSLANKEGRCTGFLNAARGVMQARQAGAARDAVAEVLEPLGYDGEVMLAFAYGYPVHDALEDKEQAIAEFAEGVHAKCLSAVTQ